MSSEETAHFAQALSGAPEGSPNGNPWPLAIEARGVGKTYELGEIASLQRTFGAIAGRLTGRGYSQDHIAAVSDVSFEVPVGECFAMMGANGSGKTTLCAMLAGITLPSSGEVRVRGRVLPLFSIGPGFHIELTGNENILLFGTVLGLPRQEIVDSIPAIADFAAISESHLGTPIKQYSTGMTARLAFATALRLSADIYIIDEALEGVDDEFKVTCLGEMEKLSKSGRTVIFISHELPLIERLCSRAMWLEKGHVRQIGPISEVAPAYSAAQAELAAKR
jgi:lipopolysaccharide transport system ATP-binding protein